MQSDKRLQCPLEETLHPWLSNMCPVKILIRPREIAGSSESLLGARARRYVFWRFGSFMLFKCRRVLKCLKIFLRWIEKKLVNLAVQVKLWRAECKYKLRRWETTVMSISNSKGEKQPLCQLRTAKVRNNRYVNCEQQRPWSDCASVKASLKAQIYLAV